MKTSGIYKIINKINKHYYVGSSCNILINRWPTHVRLLNNNKHYNEHLQRAWNKYGRRNFKFIIVETVSENKLLEIEQKYLDIAKQEKDKCYNQSFLASAPGDLSEYSKNKKIRSMHKILDNVVLRKQYVEKIKRNRKKTMLEKYGVDHNFKTEKFRTDSKNTFLKNYGVENPFQSEKIKEKMKRTWIEKYGADNPSKSEEIKKKKKETCIKNFGAGHYLQSPKLKKKHTQTIQNKYGVKNISQIPKVKEKKKKKLIEFKKFLAKMTNKEFEHYLKSLKNYSYRWKLRLKNWRNCEKDL